MDDNERQLRKQLALSRRLSAHMLESDLRRKIEDYAAELETELRQLTAGNENAEPDVPRSSSGQTTERER